MTTLTQNQIDDAARVRRRQRRGTTKRSLKYALTTAVTLVFFAPIYYLLVGSLKPNDQVLDGFGGFVPKNLSFNNYVNVVSIFDSESTGYFWNFFVSSAIVSVVIVLGGLVVNSMAAYALARLRWRGRNLILGIIILLVILPFEAIAVPLFYLMLDFRNSYFVQYIPFVASAFSIFLFYTFFIGLPSEIQEAARLDGAGPFKVFFSVIVPMSKPVFASVTILTFLAAWNSFLWPVMVVGDDAVGVRPLPLEIVVFFGKVKNWGEIFAFGVMLVAPVMAVFLSFQRFFIQSVASSAVKG